MVSCPLFPCFCVAAPPLLLCTHASPPPLLLHIYAPSVTGMCVLVAFLLHPLSFPHMPLLPHHQNQHHHHHAVQTCTRRRPWLWMRRLRRGRAWCGRRRQQLCDAAPLTSALRLLQGAAYLKVQLAWWGLFMWLHGACLDACRQAVERGLAGVFCGLALALCAWWRLRQGCQGPYGRGAVC